ncbi:MAG: gliding motility-associated C-terminal domain-containing protein, partial [Bacteroidia bacterium]
YGVAFSPSSRLLYATYISASFIPDELYQYDLQAGTQAAIIASQVVLASSFNTPNILFGALQLGPDGKLYMANFTSQLDVIQFPDVVGSGCMFTSNALTLPNPGAIGLPRNIDIGPGSGGVNVSGNNLLCGVGATVNLTVTVASGTSFIWSTGSTDTTITVGTPGLYTVSAVSSVCADTIVDTVIVSNFSPPEYSRQLFSCTGEQEIAPLMQPAPGSSFIWNTGDTTAAIQVNASGIYVVTVTNQTCVVTDTVIVDFGNSSQVAELNVFSPNGDGINDVFSFPDALPENFDLEIYSRWGNPLFRSNSPVQGWDGTFNGSATEEGVYYWRLRSTNCFGNPEERAGFVTLMR